jgi:hypothetical protein
VNVDSLLSQLAQKRPVFHSEADFQHALAWEIHLSHPAAEVRLERPFEQMHLDLLVRSGAMTCALELKYKTRRATLEHAGETFALSNHLAQDIGRYDFLKDVCRLERIVAGKPGWDGCAIILTNDASYWRSGRAGTVDSAFRLHEGRTIDPSLAWDARASAGTTKGRTSALSIRGRYKIFWQPYSAVGAHEFRYLAIQIAK